MAKRKGWGDLSENYRRRLSRHGITEASYSSGQSLAQARGKKSEIDEAFYRQAEQFAKTFVDYTPDERFTSEYGLTETSQVRKKIRENIRAMGRGPGREYMRQARAAAKAYESGELEEARAFWFQRPNNRPEYMFFYHGLFGY